MAVPGLGVGPDRGTRRAWSRQLPSGVVLTGVLPAQPVLVALADAAVAADLQLPQLPAPAPGLQLRDCAPVPGSQLHDAMRGAQPVPGMAPAQGPRARRTVWSDRACVHPRDPLVARAAWGLRVDFGPGGQPPFDSAGPVGGLQSAQRAEVAAALAAAHAVEDQIDLVSDSRWVVGGIGFRRCMSSRMAACRPMAARCAAC